VGTTECKQQKHSGLLSFSIFRSKIFDRFFMSANDLQPLFVLDVLQLVLICSPYIIARCHCTRGGTYVKENIPCPSSLSDLVFHPSIIFFLSSFFFLLCSISPSPDTARFLVVRLVNAEINRYLHNIMRAERVDSMRRFAIVAIETAMTRGEREKEVGNGVMQTRYL